MCVCVCWRRFVVFVRSCVFVRSRVRKFSFVLFRSRVRTFSRVPRVFCVVIAGRPRGREVHLGTSRGVPKVFQTCPSSGRSPTISDIEVLIS